MEKFLLNSKDNKNYWKHMKAKLIILILSALLTNSLLGQKGYKPGFIVTNQGDTVRGSIQLRSNISYSYQCPFLAAGSETPTIFSPFEISAFRIEDNKYYVATDLVIDNAKERLFLEYLVDGIVDLYYLREPGRELYFVKKDSVFTELSNNEITVVVNDKDNNGKEKKYSGSSNEYKRKLNYIFSESSTARSKLQELNFTYRDLIGITKNYHEDVCTEYDCIDYSRKLKINYFFEFAGGVKKSILLLKTSPDKISDIQPFYGVKLKVTNNKGLLKYSISTGLIFSKQDFAGKMRASLYNSHGTLSDYKIGLDYTTINVPLYVERSFGNSRISPVIGLGYNNIFIFKSENEVPYGYNNSSLRNYWFGFSAGVGFNYNLNNNGALFLKLEGEYRVPYTNTNYLLCDWTRVFSGMLNFGYCFQIKK
jgi:hypothetical protein